MIAQPTASAVILPEPEPNRKEHTNVATYRRVPIENCIVDPRYQREIKERHPALRDEFDPALLGVLEGSERDSGEVAVFDGQHRLERLRRDGQATAPVMVHQGLTPEQEADLFRRLQEGRQPLSQVETFRARLFAEDPVAVSMDGIARSKGFTIGAGPGSLQAIVAVERVFNRGNLEETLDFLNLWHGEKRALESGMIDGLSRFLELYPEADRERVRELLADTSPTVIWRRTVEVMEVARSSRARAVLEVIRSLISSRKHPLPTVASALEQRVEAVRAGQGRGYRRRVTLEQVRDAARELGVFYPEQLAEKLEISPRSLTKRGGYLEQLINRSIPAIARHRAGTKGQGGGGRFYYEYLRPQPGKRNRVKAPPPEAVAVRAASNGHGPVGHVPRVSDPAVQEVVNELYALGIRMEQGGSYLKAFPPNGSKPVSISKSSTGGRAKTLRGKLRRAGINVKR